MVSAAMIARFSQMAGRLAAISVADVSGSPLSRARRAAYPCGIRDGAPPRTTREGHRPTSRSEDPQRRAPLDATAHAPGQRLLQRSRSARGAGEDLVGRLGLRRPRPRTWPNPGDYMCATSPANRCSSSATSRRTPRLLQRLQPPRHEVPRRHRRHAERAQAFMCPYHAWTFDLNGQLIGTPNVKEDEYFDRSDTRSTRSRWTTTPDSSS